MNDEIATLIATLHQTGQRLEELTAGEVDTVADTEGRTFLLRSPQERLRQIEAGKQAAILDALPAHIALLNLWGDIVSVNEPWRRFAAENGFPGLGCGVGDNYLGACERVQYDDTAEGQQAAAGIKSVLTLRAKTFSIEYSCHSPTEDRWFLMTVVPLVLDAPNGAVVMHFDISERKRVEREMRESEERFSTAFEDAPGGLALVSISGKWLRVNRALCDLLGYSKAELLTRTFQDITHPEDLEADLENARRLIAGETLGYQMEKRYVHARGQLVAVSLNVSLVRDGRGRPSYFISQIQDITERKRSEHAAERELQRLNEAQRVGQIGDWEWDLETQVITWSPQVFAILRRDASLGPPTFEEHALMYSKASRELMLEKIALALATGDQQAYELVAPRSEGPPIHTHAVAVPLKDKDGKVVGLRGTIQDITGRKEAEKALQESEKEFRTLAESMPQMVWITRPDGWNVYFSQQWMDYTGLTLEESQGHGWNQPFHPEDQVRAWDAWLDATASVGTYSIECRLRRADGVYRWWLIRGVPVKGAGGQILKWFGTCTDIHEFKVAQLEIVRSNRVYAMLSGINALTVRARDRDELFQNACRIAVEAGGFRMALITVVGPDGVTILPLASAGKDQGLMAAVTGLLASVRAPDSMLALAIREKRAIICNDSRSDPRVLLQDAYREAGVRSIAVLPLLSGEQAVGAMAIYAGEIEFFHDDEVKLLAQLAEDIAFSMGAIRARGERDLADEALRTSLREKEALLKEVHHRVKNNMQVITSLLRLESNRIDHAVTKTVLKDMQNRIYAMATLHESLYRSDNFAQVDLGAYLRQLTSQLSRSLTVGPGHVQFRLDLLSVGLDLDQAIPCGLIVNELASNALKHAFPQGRSGEVSVQLRWVREGTLLLRISDDGVGLPADFEARRDKSLGLQLVSDLARQLQGTLRIGPAPQAVFEVTFSPRQGVAEIEPLGLAG